MAMTIYIDELRNYNGKLWCHVATDGPIEELHQFATFIGVHRKWFQNTQRCPHYDLTPAARNRAVLNGAKEVAAVELWKRCNTIGKHKDSIFTG